MDDDVLFAFYDERVPAGIVSARHFDAWWKAERGRRPDLLDAPPELLLRAAAGELEEEFPGRWRQGGIELPLSYRFEPGADGDGVTVRIPLAMLNQVSAWDFEWQVPGLREELVTALIRALPKPIRRQLGPAPDRAREALGHLRPRSEPLLPALSRELGAIIGVSIDPADWRPADVPAHLRMTFLVHDDAGRELSTGKDLAALTERLRPQVAQAVSAAAPDLERIGLTGWPIEVLPRVVERRQGDAVLRGYPALVERDGGVDLRVLPSEHAQRRAMRAGTRRLLTSGVSVPVRSVLAGLDTPAKLALSRAPHDGPTALMDDCVGCAVDAVVDAAGGPAWDLAGFEVLTRLVRRDLAAILTDVVTTTSRALQAAQQLELALATPAACSPVLGEAIADVRDQLAGLVYPGFVTATGRERLGHLVRYLQAALRRVQVLPERAAKDSGLMAEVHQVAEEYREVRAGLPEERRDAPDVRAVRWMIEELRVGLFAPGIRTAHPVSVQRVQRAIDGVLG
jgi:ATP-dependent helicase HrpA